MYGFTYHQPEVICRSVEILNRLSVAPATFEIGDIQSIKELVNHGYIFCRLSDFVTSVSALLADSLKT
jgi:hypothetical protein